MNSIPYLKMISPPIRPAKEKKAFRATVSYGEVTIRLVSDAARLILRTRKLKSLSTQDLRLGLGLGLGPTGIRLQLTPGVDQGV